MVNKKYPFVIPLYRNKRYCHEIFSEDYIRSVLSPNPTDEITASDDALGFPLFDGLQ